MSLDFAAAARKRGNRQTFPAGAGTIVHNLMLRPDIAQNRRQLRSLVLNLNFTLPVGDTVIKIDAFARPDTDWRIRRRRKIPPLAPQ